MEALPAKGIGCFHGSIIGQAWGETVLSYMAVFLRPYHRPSLPNNAEAEHVGFSGKADIACTYREAP